MQPPVCRNAKDTGCTRLCARMQRTQDAHNRSAKDTGCTRQECKGHWTRTTGVQSTQDAHNRNATDTGCTQHGCNEHRTHAGCRGLNMHTTQMQMTQDAHNTDAEDLICTQDAEDAKDTGCTRTEMQSTQDAHRMRNVSYNGHRVHPPACTIESCHHIKAAKALNQSGKKEKGHAQSRTLCSS